MGGPGSSRWGMTVTRVTTEGLPQLDVRVLARAGALCPGGVATVSWGPGATITTMVPADAPDTVVLRYATVTSGSGGVSVEEPIGVTATRCTFGGSRVWFVCPGCDGRCAVLYGLAGVFRCRACHHLAYASTRVSRHRSGATGA